MYTEEELLEAVDILVEEYGFYEDEAIEMIAEQFKVSRENMNGRHNIKTWGQKVSNGVTEDEANKHGASNIYFNPDHTYKDDDHVFRAIDHGSNRESFTERRNKYKQRAEEGEKAAKKVNTVKNAAIGGFVLANGVYLAHKAYKKYKKNNAKQDLKNRNIQKRGRK